MSRLWRIVAILLAKKSRKGLWKMGRMVSWTVDGRGEDSDNFFTKKGVYDVM